MGSTKGGTGQGDSPRPTAPDARYDRCLRPSGVLALRWRIFDGEKHSRPNRNCLPWGRLDPSARRPRALARCIYPMTLPPSSGSGSCSVRTLPVAAAFARTRSTGNALRMTRSSRTRMAGSWILQLPQQGPKASRGFLRYLEAELPGDLADHRYQGTESGFGEGYPIAPAALSSRYHGE